MNTNEAAVAAFLENKGHRVIRRGWPDFLCLKYGYLGGGRWDPSTIKGVVAVEVKAGKDRLSPDQQMVHKILTHAGIPVYVLRSEQLDKNVRTRPLPLLTNSEMREMASTVERLTMELQVRQVELQRLAEEIAAARQLLATVGDIHNGSGLAP